MKRKFWLCTSLVAVLCLVGAEAALAATANFQGNCTNSTTGGGVLWTTCDFNPNRAPAGEPYTGCNGADVSSYGWAFGDGTSGTSSPSNGVITHAYSGPVAVTITLTVTCNNGATPSASHAMSNYVGCSGCIAPGGGWMPY
jgi:PKD domain